MGKRRSRAASKVVRRRKSAALAIDGAGLPVLVEIESDEDWASAWVVGMAEWNCVICPAVVRKIFGSINIRGRKFELVLLRRKSKVRKARKAAK